MNPIYRPSTLEDIIARSFRVYIANLPRITFITIITEIPLIVMGYVYRRIALTGLDDPLHTLNIGEIPDEEVFNILLEAFAQNMVAIVGWGLLLGTIALALIVIRYGALVHATSEQNIRRPIRINRAYAFTLEKFWYLLLASILTTLALSSIIVISFLIGVIFAPLITIAAGMLIFIYMSVRWFFIVPVIVLEERGPLEAIARSSELVQNNWWRTFRVLLVILVILLFFSSVVVIIVPILGTIVSTILVTPLFVIGQTHLYFDLRVRTDGPSTFTNTVLAEELRIRIDDTAPSSEL